MRLTHLYRRGDGGDIVLCRNPRDGLFYVPAWRDGKILGFILFRPEAHEPGRVREAPRGEVQIGDPPPARYLGEF